MSKHVLTEPQGVKQCPAPIPATSPGDTSLPQDGGTLLGDPLKEGNGVILGTGNGIPVASPSDQRQALIAAAQAGNVDAQSQLGDIYRVGDEFTKQDYAEALRWYRLAAEQGEPNAENNLGAMYDNAFGVPKDMAEAARWYRLSADQGLSTAQFNLAECLLYGNGVNEDEFEAAQWLHKAAAQGHIEALSELGDLYRWGHGVERRIVNAAELHVTAALAGNAQSAASLGDYREDIEKEALSGRMLASLCLAKMYDRGLGVPEDKAKMLAWLLWGDERGNRNEDPDVYEELDAMRGFYGMTLSDAIKDEAWALFNQMRAANPVAHGTVAKKRRKPSARRKSSANHVAGGG